MCLGRVGRVSTNLSINENVSTPCTSNAMKCLQVESKKLAQLSTIYVGNSSKIKDFTNFIFCLAAWVQCMFFIHKRAKIGILCTVWTTSPYHTTSTKYWSGRDRPIWPMTIPISIFSLTQYREKIHVRKFYFWEAFLEKKWSKLESLHLAEGGGVRRPAVQTWNRWTKCF